MCSAAFFENFTSKTLLPFFVFELFPSVSCCLLMPCLLLLTILLWSWFFCDCIMLVFVSIDGCHISAAVHFIKDDKSLTKKICPFSQVKSVFLSYSLIKFDNIKNDKKNLTVCFFWLLFLKFSYLCFCYNIGFQQQQQKKQQQKKITFALRSVTSFFKNIFYLLL